MRRLTLRCAAGAAVLGLALTGCSEKQQASETLPSSSAEPTADALPPLGPDDLPMPDEARTQDAAGAEAFVRYYVELINRTSTVMDAQPLREFSDGCDECIRLAVNTEEAAAAGHRFRDGEISILELGEPLVEGDTAQVAMRVDQAKFQVLDASGAPVDGGSEPYTDISAGIALAWHAGQASWLMTQLTFSS